MNIVQIHLAVVQPFTQRTTGSRFMHLLPGFPHALQGTWRIVSRRRGFGVFTTLNADNVRYQHGMVRGYRAARLGDYRRMRQTVFFTGVANSPDDVVGVFVQTVVYGTVRLRTGTFVIYAQTTAHVEALDINAKLVQLNVETRRLTYAGGDITNVRHLGAEMEVQQLDAVQTTTLAQNFYQLQHLVCRQAEF